MRSETKNEVEDGDIFMQSEEAPGNEAEEEEKASEEDKEEVVSSEEEHTAETS